MRWLNSLTAPLRHLPLLRRLGNRYGRSYWKLPALLRRRICWQRSVPRLRGTQTWRCGAAEMVGRADSIDAVRNPSLGHLLAAESFRVRTPFVTRLDEAWLVGPFASPVTLDGRLLLSAFREEPRLLGLEPHPELERWLAAPASRGSELPDLEHVCPMVNRLQSNYYHWLVEWCARLELLETYRQKTGRVPKLLIPETAPKFLRESLTLLGYGPESCLSWAIDSAPRKVHELVLPSLRESDVAPAPSALRWLRRRFLAAVEMEAAEPDRVIYLSRPRDGWRSVLNDEEIADWFLSEGHEVLQPHHWPLAEQIRRFSKATLVVGLHGAGLTNLLFAPGATLLELTGDYGDGVYFGMAARLGQTYEAFPCRSVGADVTVDLEALKKRVAALAPGRRHTGVLAHV